MAATFTFGAAMTLRAGGHIRVSLLLGRASPGVVRVLEVFAALVGFLFVAFLSYAMFNFTYGSFVRGQTSVTSATPVWIPQAVVTFGIALLASQLFARLLQALLGLPTENHSMKAAASVE
jgi:TRAP-type C4-dicarboxylate transport system permease small subunit